MVERGKKESPRKSPLKSSLNLAKERRKKDELWVSIQSLSQVQQRGVSRTRERVRTEERKAVERRREEEGGDVFARAYQANREVLESYTERRSTTERLTPRRPTRVPTRLLEENSELATSVKLMKMRKDEQKVTSIYDLISKQRRKKSVFFFEDKVKQRFLGLIHK